jgi:hypothetical protein
MGHSNQTVQSFPHSGKQERGKHMATTIYSVRFDGIELATTKDLETAIRLWDGMQSETRDATGGIHVTTTKKDGTVTRAGWILHVTEGHTYLNPHLKEQ